MLHPIQSTWKGWQHRPLGPSSMMFAFPYPVTAVGHRVYLKQVSKWEANKQHWTSADATRRAFGLWDCPSVWFHRFRLCLEELRVYPLSLRRRNTSMCIHILFCRLHINFHYGGLSLQRRRVKCISCRHGQHTYSIHVLLTPISLHRYSGNRDEHRDRKLAEIHVFRFFALRVRALLRFNRSMTSRVSEFGRLVIQRVSGAISFPTKTHSFCYCLA